MFSRVLTWGLFSSATAALSSFDDWPHLRVTLNDVSIHARYYGSGPPLVLVHGNPQFSLTWRRIGPILAEKYTVIAPDNRGAGDSSIPSDGNYTSAASADDIKGLLDFLNITETYVFSHDKGVGPATALAVKHDGLVKRLGVSEYALPGFGYEAAAVPGYFWELYQNFQLAFFSIPDAAEFFIKGREKQMLEWYFYHMSYSGVTAFTEDIVNRYATSISKPGFLRAMLGPFAAKTVGEDALFFNATLGATPLAIPVLAMGGEAGFGQGVGDAFGPVMADLTADIVPKAGHWIADENPVWVANRIIKFLAEDASPPQSVDLSWLDDKVTLTVGYLGTYRNQEIASNQPWAT
ncbi:hypothetical protein N0V82_000473 [Gnomoniopsis sp. IMI 355080]|nr:hypothetical protein N0V82_000473 [Gnomoniopsis sp. IMI 355080]